MKHLTLTLAIAMLTGFQLVAQNSESGNSTSDSKNGFKPGGGDKNLEVQFTPFGTSVIQINGIRGRMFQSSTRALRANLFLGFNSNTTVTQQADSLGSEELKSTSSSFTINLRPGMEFHLSGTDRLSPYLGFEADLAFQTTTDATEVQPGPNTVNTDRTINDNGFVRFGVNAVAGFDFYVAKKVYMGTELGYGLSFRKNLAERQLSDRAGFNEPDPVVKGGSFNLGPTVNATIRLGYLF